MSKEFNIKSKAEIEISSLATQLVRACQEHGQAVSLSVVNPKTGNATTRGVGKNPEIAASILLQLEGFIDVLESPDSCNCAACQQVKKDFGVGVSEDIEPSELINILRKVFGSEF